MASISKFKFSSLSNEDLKMQLTQNNEIKFQPHPTLCIQFLDRENNYKNNTLPSGKQICFTIVWGCAEILPSCEQISCNRAKSQILTPQSRNSSS